MNTKIRKTIVIVLALAAILPAAEETGKKNVLESTIAGQWYPADAAKLTSILDNFFQKADVKPKNNVIAMILPHAGYQFSGQTAACGVKAAGGTYKRIIVIGPSHSMYLPGVLSVPDATHYKTPLGEVPLDTEFTGKLLKNEMFKNIPQAYIYEHSVQIELPLLQCHFKGFKFVPIVAGACSPEQVEKAAAALKNLMENETLVIASSDFVHYGPNYDYVPFTENIPEQIKKLDMGAFDYIAKIDAKGFLEYKNKTGATICGSVPIAILLSMQDKSAKAELVKYATSGELTGDFSNSVSYLAVAFCGSWKEKTDMKQQDTKKEQTNETLSQADKKALLNLARRSLVYYLENRRPPKPADLGIQLTSAMTADGAAFVTLEENSQLRGCIGDVIARGPLYDSVIRNAVNAGVNDWRFKPVTREECNELSFEISVLTEPKPVPSAKDIKIGIDGVVLKKADKSALFLPQVAPEQGWDINQMLTHLSLKAGLPGDAWKEGATFLTFRAIVFSEKEK